MELKILGIFLSLFLLIQLYLIRVITKAYLLPSSIFTFYWFIFTFFPLILLFNVSINPISIIYINLFIFSFSLSSLHFNWQYALDQNKLNKKIILSKLNSNFIVKIFYFSIFCAIIFSSLQVISNGFSFGFFIVNFIETSARYAALRGNEYIEYGLIGTLSIFFTYFSSLLGGVVVVFKSTKSSKLGYFILAIFPSLYAMLIQSSKLIFLVALIFYLASILLIKIISNKHSIINFKEFLKMVFIAVLLLPLIIIAFISREGYNNFDNFEEGLNLLLPAIYSYMFGSLYAFSDFFSYYLGFHSMSIYNIEYYNLGYYSFKSMFDLFGGTKVFPPGFYSDNYDFKDVLSTNLFTFFRGFIQDFGVIGSLIFNYFMGFFFHFQYYKLLLNKNIWLSCSIFVIFIGYIGLSFLINIFTARYVFLIAIVFYLILKINSLIFNKKNNKKIF